MELRCLHLPAFPRRGDDRARGNILSAAHRHPVEMAIGADPAAAMVDQYQPAEQADFIAGIGHIARRRCPHRCAQCCGDVDAVIHPAIARRAKSLEDAPLKRPGKARWRTGRAGHRGRCARRGRSRSCARIGTIGRAGRWSAAGHDVINVERERLRLFLDGSWATACPATTRPARIARRPCGQPQPLADAQRIGRLQRIVGHHLPPINAIGAGDGDASLASLHFMVSSTGNGQLLAGAQCIGRLQCVGAGQCFGSCTGAVANAAQSIPRLHGIAACLHRSRIGHHRGRGPCRRRAGCAQFNGA